MGGWGSTFFGKIYLLVCKNRNERLKKLEKLHFILKIKQKFDRW